MLETDSPPPWSGGGGRYAMRAILDEVRRHRTTLIFHNTRAQAELFFHDLWLQNDEGLPIGIHHGSLAREQRERVEAAMTEGKLRAVVCTGSLDLGIDWGDVDLVIQVGAPKNVKRLVQRIGRANHRYNAPSKALILPANRFEVVECRAALDAVRDHTLDGEPRGDLEPAAGWTRIPDLEEVSDATQLVSIDQRAAYLASAGMLEFGYGKPRHLRGEDALDAARQSKTPFGLWRVTLPPGDMLALPPALPLPHPHMLADQPVQTWITTVSLDALQTSIADGGIGAELDDLDIAEAWVYPEQGRALDKWAKFLREARKVAVDTGDTAMKRFIGACYKGYIGRMVNPDMWTAKQMQHHHQPLWRAAIIAHCRWRGRRVAMRIARETGRWPLRTVTDSWVYPLPPGIDIADNSDALGKMTLEKSAPLTENITVMLTDARDTHEINLALKAAFTDEDEGNI